MKLLDCSEIDDVQVFDTCLSGLANPFTTGKFNAHRPDILLKFQQYKDLAEEAQLFQIVASAWAQEQQEVVGNITKKEFVDLYSEQMVDGNAPGRKHYNEIMMLAPLGKCPFCGFGHASTLDHFLPKARYPAFSTLTVNLIPCCKDCNKGKGSSQLSEENQIPHPYFEDTRIETETWLVATVIREFPTTIQYRVVTPADWPIKLMNRVNNYFRDLDLNLRFGVEAASELASISNTLAELPDSIARHLYLSAISNAEQKLYKNSWKAALYKALCDDAWFCDSGYKRMVV